LTFEVLRTPTFRDDDMTYRLPPTGRHLNEIQHDDLVCKDSQIAQNETADSPSLRAAPGDTLIMFYQENGHVTKIDTDAGHSSSGIISVFGSVNSKAADTLQDITNTHDPLPGVTLLRQSNFDDGHCYQNNGSPVANERKMTTLSRTRLHAEGPDVWCSVQFKLPTFLQPSDIYSLYWIWNFDGIGFVERYTTCVDVIIT
jgi:hypothetical protein